MEVPPGRNLWGNLKNWADLRDEIFRLMVNHPKHEQQWAWNRATELAEVQKPT